MCLWMFLRNGVNVMPEIEKVIKGLECCIKSDSEVICPGDCPYDDDGDFRCETMLKRDAAAILKFIQKEGAV